MPKLPLPPPPPLPCLDFLSSVLLPIEYEAPISLHQAAKDHKYALISGYTDVDPFAKDQYDMTALSYAEGCLNTMYEVSKLEVAHIKKCIDAGGYETLGQIFSQRKEAVDGYVFEKEDGSADVLFLPLKYIITNPNLSFEQINHMVVLLAQHGNDVGIIDDDGKNCLHYAYERAAQDYKASGYQDNSIIENCNSLIQNITIRAIGKGLTDDEFACLEDKNGKKPRDYADIPGLRIQPMRIVQEPVPFTRRVSFPNQALGM